MRPHFSVVVGLVGVSMSQEHINLTVLAATDVAKAESLVL